MKRLGNAFIFSLILTSLSAESGAVSAWDNSSGLPPVGNQGVAGSCFAWATAYYQLTYLQGQEYGWDLTDPEHQCSPAFVYNLTNGGVDNGAASGHYPRRDAYHVFETMGCATMADMPYSAYNYSRFPSEAAFRNAMRFRTASTHFIDVDTESGLQELKNRLLAGNIATLGINGYSNFDNIGNFGNTYCASEITGPILYWHEVTVVGFDDDFVTADGVGAFRFVNSAGPYWGDGGFFWMSYEAVMDARTSCRYIMYAVDRTGYEPTLVLRTEVVHSDRYRLAYRVGLGAFESPEKALNFFDFNPRALATVEYPQSAIVLDITDMAELLNDADLNQFFLSIMDEAEGDRHSGAIMSVSVEDLRRNLASNSQDTPITIPDTGVEVVAALTLDYTLPLPENLTAELDHSNGLVQLTWDVPVDPQNILNYHVYMNGGLIDSTVTNSCLLQLPETGHYRLAVSAQTEEGESLLAFTDVDWPLPAGLPFSDGFEDGLVRWMQMGDPNTVAAITADRAHGGGYALELQTNESDDAIIVRGFDQVEYLEIDVWFNLESYPGYESGFGGCIALINSEDNVFLVFVAESGNLVSGTIMSSEDQNINVIDSLFTVELDRWYEYSIRYEPGRAHMKLMDDAGSVLIDEVDEIPEFQVNMVALAASGLNSGRNYFDDFLIREVIVESISLSEEGHAIPKEFSLIPAYPNPFNRSTVIRVELPEASRLELTVYNILGARVAELATNTFSAGRHSFVFDAAGLASGIYFIRATVPGKMNAVGKALLLH